jgi:hypothetical protein
MAVGTVAAVITSTYLSLSATGGPESEIPANTTTLFVIVKAEAGSAVIGLGATYRIHALLQDITNFANLLNVRLNQHFGDTGLLFPPGPTPDWTPATANQDVTFAFQATGLSLSADTVLQPLAFLTVGGETSVAHGTPVVVV